MAEEHAKDGLEEFTIEENDSLRLQLINERVDKLQSQLAFALNQREMLHGQIHNKYTQNGDYVLEGELNILSGKGQRRRVAAAEASPETPGVASSEKH